MSWPPDFFDWLTPEAWATYVVGILALLGVYFGARYQIKKNLRLSRQSKVFDELSADIRKAGEKVSSITNTTADITQKLANAADNALIDTSSLNESQKAQEIERRSADLENIAESQVANVEAIYGSYDSLLKIIKNIEKNTVIGNVSKKAARQLFYISTEQHQLVKSMSDVLISFNATPPLGGSPNITPQTFNAFINLIGSINSKNSEINNYLEDLEVILHNDLVRDLYNKAEYNQLPNRRLTPDGIMDKRSEQSLV